MLFRVLRLTASTLLNISEKKTPDEFHIWQYFLKKETFHHFLHCEKEPSCHRKMRYKY